MKKYLWLHFKAFDQIKDEVLDDFAVPADETFFGTEEELREVAYDASEWRQFEEVEESDGST